MTKAGTFRTDRTALLACADALAEHGRWVAAARFAERAVPAHDPDYGDVVRVAWFALRAGRAKQAAERLAALPEDAHRELRAMRLTAAGMSEPDTATRRLAELRTELASREPSPIGLRLMVLLAEAAGDRATALVAAQRFDADVATYHPDMRRIMAVDQAGREQIAEAVVSTEHVIGGSIGEPEAPIREIADDIAARDRPLTTLRFLADGYLRTGRREYVTEMLARLPLRARQRNRVIGLSVSATVLGVGCAVAGTTSALFGAGMLLLILGAFVALWAVVLRVPGASRAQTNQMLTARARYRTSLGLPDLASVLAGAAAGGFTLTAMFARGEGGPISTTALTVAVCVGVGAVLGALTWYLVHRHRARAKRATLKAPVSPELCRCWEIGAFTGARWRTYLAEHLVSDGGEPSLEAEQRHCPDTGKLWLHLPPAGVTVALNLPAEPPAAAGYL